MVSTPDLDQNTTIVLNFFTTIIAPQFKNAPFFDNSGRSISRASTYALLLHIARVQDCSRCNMNTNVDHDHHHTIPGATNLHNTMTQSTASAHIRRKLACVPCVSVWQELTERAGRWCVTDDRDGSWLTMVSLAASQGREKRQTPTRGGRKRMLPMSLRTVISSSAPSVQEVPSHIGLALVWWP